MDKRFLHYFKIVAAVHIVIIATLTAFSGCAGFFKKKEEKIVAVKFMVAVPSSGSTVSVAESPIPAPVSPPVNKPVPVSPSPTPKDKKLKGVEDIKISKDKVKRNSDKKKPEKYLSDEEIKKLLMEGAEAGDANILPGEEARCLAKVRKVLHDAWAQPSSDEAGGVVAEVKIRLLLDGRIVERSLVRKSGNSLLDDSVMRAVNSVSGINGLAPAFIKEHSSITISFEVQ